MAENVGLFVDELDPICMLIDVSYDNVVPDIRKLPELIHAYDPLSLTQLTDRSLLDALIPIDAWFLAEELKIRKTV